MSANLQREGLDQGFELGVHLGAQHSDGRATELKQRLDAWIGEAAWALHLGPQLGDLQGAVQIWQSGKLNAHEIKLLEEIKLGMVTATSADALDAPMPPLPRLPANGTLPRMAHQLRCTWTVAPPTLAAKAKEIKRSSGQDKQPPLPYSPPAYREPNGRIVVAIRIPNELTAAAVVKQEAGAEAIVVIKEDTP